MKYLIILLIVFTNDLVFSQSAGTIKSLVKISSTTTNFTKALSDNDLFGRGIACLGDLNGDGNKDFAIASPSDNSSTGAVYIIFTNSDFSVKSYYKISSTSPNFTGQITTNDYFGYSLTSLGDLDGDGITDIAVGARFSGFPVGAVFIIFLNKDGTVKSFKKITNGSGNLSVTNGYFGSNITTIGDLNHDGVIDIAVNADRGEDSNGIATGVVYILFLNSDGTVKSAKQLQSSTGFTASLRYEDYLGTGLSSMPDMDGDGNKELLIGARNDRTGGISSGALFITFMNSDGTVKSYKKLASDDAILSGIISSYGFFGVSSSYIGDLDGDNVSDIVVGASGGSSNSGKIIILYLNSDCSIKGYSIIGNNEGKFSGLLDNGDTFGWGIATYDDSNYPGIKKLVVGASGDDDGGTNRGAVWFLDIYTSYLVGFSYSDTCINACVNFNFNGTLNFDSLKWDFGDNSYSYLDTVCHKYSSVGNYKVTLYGYFNNNVYSYTKTITVISTPSQPGPITGQNEICINSTSNIYSVPSQSDVTSYIWMYNGTEATIIDTSYSINLTFNNTATDGALTVAAKNLCGISDTSNAFPITLKHLPDDAGAIVGSNNVCINQGNILYYVPLIGNADSYIWNYTGTGDYIIGNSDSIYMYFFNNATSGVLTVYGENSCGNGKLSAGFPIISSSCSEYYESVINIPNAFTPNGDGINDYFVIKGLVENTKVQIFNRLGKLMYSSDNYLNNWDGRDNAGNIMETATYWYIITVPGMPNEFKGFVYLKK